MDLPVSQTDWATVCQSRDDSGDIDRLALNHGAHARLV